MTATTILRARKILTMNSYQPEATHVAIRDGKVLGVGNSPEDLAGWGEATLDEQFADKVLMPGFVEGHCHAKEGGMWDFPFVGYLDRTDPDGTLWEGADTMEKVVQRLSSIEKGMPEDQMLFAWGFDPIYFDGARMELPDIDRVSTTRPIVILHSNGHVINVNSAVLEKAGISRETNVDGVVKDAAGNPTGELAEQAAKYMAYRVTGDPFFKGISEHDLVRFGQACANCGVTTATDLFAVFTEESLKAYSAATRRDGYPIRIMPAMNTLDRPPAEGVEALNSAKKGNNSKLIYQLVKIMTDGSIQGMSARMKWPGYYNGIPNGVWNAPPEQLVDMVHAYNKADAHIHMHVNGDEASELMIDALEDALAEHPRRDHRHTLQHCQMADESQFRRMAALGICSNMFANHIYYWGDQHRDITMGPDRAARMDACRTAERHGVNFAIHSDAPVTPLAPLFTAWCAVNRLTASGKVLGENEKISVESALYAITLGAAYTLKMDHLVGSIEPGKWADFAVLEQDPYEVDPEGLKDIPVWGTVTAGVATQAAGRG